MQCPICHRRNPNDAKYCNACGCRIWLPKGKIPGRRQIEDPYMDDRLQKLQRYLPQGLTQKILAQKDKIEGERKQVTVMFCDMVGFTTFIDALGPEAGYTLMDQVYEILIHNVREYDGTINEMTGDGIMALFGAPIAIEDAPQRALRSALAIHREIRRFNDAKLRRISVPPIKMRIGIHTGPAVVGTLGNDLRVEFKAVGDTVNMASRMEALAEPGTTYVTEKTYKLSRELFKFKSVGEKAVKGKKESMVVYKLLAAVPDLYRPRVGSERMIYSKMVGRRRELDRLELQVLKLINGEGSVVSIIGEAGIGKSRLIAELKGCEVMKRVTMVEGRAISMGRNLSFHPIIDILKQWARIKENDGEVVSLKKLETAVKSVLLEEVEEILPFVATLMGMNLSGKYAERVKGIEGEALEKLIIKAMRDLLIKVSRISPLVIVAEDIHWADSSSIDLMMSLIKLIENNQILFILVFRYGYKETSDRILKTLKENLSVDHIELNLRPLNNQKSESLINNMLKIRSLPHGVEDQIIRRAGGNPFFIEEVVRSFIDDEVVVIKNGRFEVTDKIESVFIPQTINDVLMSRIDRLEDQTRDLVKVASIIGRNFFYRILKAVAEKNIDIDRHLSYLKEIQLIKERQRMKELEYLFKHALAQEAAYASILHEKRKELHLKVAHAIEKVFRDKLPEFYGSLAYHYSRGESLEKAEEYLVKAGEEALRTSASAEALNYYQEGLKLYLRKYCESADPEKLALFEKNIALALFNKGQYERAAIYFESVLERWGVGTPKNTYILKGKLAYDLFGVIINLYLAFGKSKKVPTQRDNEIFDMSYKKAITLVHLDPQRCFSEFISTIKLLNKFDISKTENGFGMWISASGLFSYTGISFNLSKKILSYSKDIIDKSEVKHNFYFNLFELLHNSYTGNWSDIKDYDDNLVLLNLRLGEYWHVSTYIVFYGYLKLERGAFDEVEKIINKLFEISEAYGNENATEYRYSLKIILLILSHKFLDALKEVKSGIEFHRQTGRDLILIYYLGYKAIIQIQLEDIKGAQESLSAAKEIVAKFGFVPPIYISGFLKGQFEFDLYMLKRAIRSNATDETLKYIRKAKKSGQRALRNSLKYAFDRTEILRLMGVYYWVAGNHKKAIRYWNHSIKVSKTFGADVQRAKTCMEIGRRIREKRRRFENKMGIAASDYLDQAKNLFEKFGMQQDLEELKRISD